MPPKATCPDLTREYDLLLAKKREFDTALKTAEIAKTPEETTAALARALALKAELIERKRALEDQLFVSLETAEAILGKENVLSETEAIFGIKNETRIPFKRKELEHAKSLAEKHGTVLELIYQSSEMKDPKTGETIPINHKNLKRIFPKAHDGKSLFYTQDWYEGEEGKPFYETETPANGWKLVERDILPASTGKNYAEQTEILANIVRTEMFPDNKIPENYQAALTEWNDKKSEITALLATKKEADWKKASDILASLKLTDLTRESSIDILYRLIFADRAKQRKELTNKWAWSKTRTRASGFVYAGNFASTGAFVSRNVPRYSSDTMGVCLSRMKE